MKNNKKGFTLIELLAVIVILAVIALIAVPQVLKILNQARRSAAEDSAYGVIKAAESYVATYMMDHQGDWDSTITFTCTKTDGKGECSNGETDADKKVTLDFKGTKPTAGVIALNSDGEAKITTALEINGFTCNYISENSDTIKCSTKSETTTSTTPAGE